MADNNEEANAPRFYNYPEPQKVDIPYTKPDTPRNPVVRGLPLYYGASLIASVSLIQDLLWKNTGFNRLRGRKELEDVAPRYDPTVIRLDAPHATTTTSGSADNVRLPGPTANGRFYSVYDYHEAYASGRTTPTAVVEALLPLLQRDGAEASPHATAWVELREDLILAAAAASTERYERGESLGALDGVPVTVKDEVDVAGYGKRMGTRQDWSPVGGARETAFCVAQWQAAGAVVVGKTTMHELGLDTTNNNPNPHHGTPRNPYSAQHYTGGSSGGSGYAVGAGLVPVALGADGGGSIRIPAGYCGVYGLKTSHGRVSGRPTPSLAPSTGVLGPIAANVADLELAYRVMATPDAQHASSAHFAAPLPASISYNRPKLLGVCQAWLDEAEPAVAGAVTAAIDALVARHAYQRVPIHLPLLADGQAAHALTILSEIASTPFAAPAALPALTPANKILLSVGRHAGAVDLLQAQRLRALLMQHLAHLFRTHAPGLIVVSPATPAAAPPIVPADLAHGVCDGNASIRSMRYAWLANLCGCPALSAPIAYIESGQQNTCLPVALMGMAEWGAEDALLAFGYDVETYLNDSDGGGRRRPHAWVDMLRLATDTEQR